jgi:hypothetical protein
MHDNRRLAPGVLAVSDVSPASTGFGSVRNLSHLGRVIAAHGQFAGWHRRFGRKARHQLAS